MGILGTSNGTVLGAVQAQGDQQFKNVNNLLSLQDNHVEEFFQYHGEQFLFFSINSLNLNITLALCRAGFSDQASKALFAIETASSKSEVFARITSDCCSPVAGLKTFPFLLEEPAINLPPTKCCIKFMAKIV